jgi:Fe-S cluster assembly iron-binding protein IscA
MQVTEAAATRLRGLLDRLGEPVRGLRFEGYVGTCRGSTPVLRPAAAADENDASVTVAGITFFVPAEHLGVFEVATMDDDRSAMGLGINLTWPHGAKGCRCQG